MPVFLHYQQDRLNSILKGHVSNRWLFLNAHIYTCRTVSNAYHWRMQICMQICRKVSTHIWPTHVLHIFVVHIQICIKVSMHIWQTLAYNIQKSVKSIYLMKAQNTQEKGQIHIKRMFACKYAEKCQMHICQTQIWNISNAYAELSIHMTNAYCIFANMHKSY